MKPDLTLLEDVVAPKVLDAIYLKLKSPRQKDRVDVIEFVKAGIDIEAARRYLAANAPQLVARFDEAVAHAAAEE